ncbi:dicarboxylate/amino acid:cation symporter [Sphingomonas sp. URHD0057]|uniref:dicarboxylate/amino acid:cation symporter n=1 Tax=Sphingomonas sp. URHD0057 TaxID=1380389 RepID=UPI0006843AE6|nr:dicarboxylate/amino acid:cation symporter [Sphingomonas sp. URHD0057]
MTEARRPIWKSLYVQVLVAITLGVVVGWLWPTTGAALKPLGDGFIKLVKMIITPVIFLTVVTGIAGMRDLRAFGRIAAKAFAYFIVMSTLALVVGLAVANLVQPGAGLNVNVATLDTGKVASYVTKAHETTVTGFVLNIIPDTLVSAFTSGEILQVLLVAILFGIALATMGERGERLLGALRTLTAVVFRIVRILMYAAPIGAFGAMAFTIGQYGIGTLVNLAQLIVTFYATSLLFVLVILGSVAWFAGFSILALIRYIKDELLLVLGTSSSESAMPLLMEKLEAAGCPKPIVGLVVPTGYSFNLDGTNIYMSLAALFIAQACNVHLSLGDQLLLMAVAVLSSKGAAGVTGSGFIVLAATLSVVPSIPVAGMALILGVDRFMSECRSLTNFVGNAVATIVVARWEGAVDMVRLRRVLASGEPSAEEIERIQLQRG